MTQHNATYGDLYPLFQMEHFSVPPTQLSIAGGKMSYGFKPEEKALEQLVDFAYAKIEQQMEGLQLGAPVVEDV